MPTNLPIVFLPGVMGSRLFFPNSEKFWDPDHRGRMLQWVPIPFFRSPDYLRRQIHVAEPAGVLIGHDQPASEIDATGKAWGWGSVAWSFYGEFLKDLRRRFGPAPIYAVGYDWRRDIWALAEFLRGRIEAILRKEGAGQVILVTHSMGGLVARAAFARTPSMQAKIRGVLHLFQPAHGAIVLYRRFFTGVHPDFDEEATIADRVFRLILGGDAATFTGNMSGLPGAFQLLPGPGFPAGGGQLWNPFLAGGLAAIRLYADGARPPGLMLPDLAADVRAELQARLAELDRFHRRLGGANHNNTWAVYGTGLNTDVAIAFGSTGSPQPLRVNQGDGTVPLLSGSGLFSQPGVVFHPSMDLAQERQFVVSGVAHANACQHQAVRDLAQQIIAVM
jgi:hypothetical protein